LLGNPEEKGRLGRFKFRGAGDIKLDIQEVKEIYVIE